MCLVDMGVDIPEAAVASILHDQRDWVKKCEKRAAKDNLHKRYMLLKCACIFINDYSQELTKEGKESPP